MSSAPTRHILAHGIDLLISSDSKGGGEATIIWTAEAGLNADFVSGRDKPALALETTLSRVERLGTMSQLDFSAVLGVLVGYLLGRAR